MKFDHSHMATTVDGTEIHIGDTITDFRGARWIFEGISRVPGDGTDTNGKIIVKDAGAQVGFEESDPEPWRNRAEFYPERVRPHDRPTVDRCRATPGTLQGVPGFFFPPG